jgi:hypothetical protein
MVAPEGTARSGIARWSDLLRRYPLPVSGLFLFSVFMTFVYLPYDMLVKPFTQSVAQAEEVWFGFMLRGWAAKLTEPLHWLIYAALGHGFYRDRPWAFALGALYALQVAIGMLVWAALYVSPGVVWMGSIVASLLFAVLAAAVWRARPAARRA